MDEKHDLLNGTSIWDWFLAAFFGAYIGLVGGFGILYLAKRSRENKESLPD
jgi:hypothetical protein